MHDRANVTTIEPFVGRFAIEHDERMFGNHGSSSGYAVTSRGGRSCAGVNAGMSWLWKSCRADIGSTSTQESVRACSFRSSGFSYAARIGQASSLPPRAGSVAALVGRSGCFSATQWAGRARSHPVVPTALGRPARSPRRGSRRRAT